jgi:hypothetical protein
LANQPRADVGATLPACQAGWGFDGHLRSVITARGSNAPHVTCASLDRPRNPIRAVNIITHTIKPWNAVGEAFKPIGDPRHNRFDWQSWYKCDVFPGEVANAMLQR